MTTTARKLVVSTDSFDRVNTFSVEVWKAMTGRKVRLFACSLHRNKEVAGDGLLWIMQHAGMIAASYSPAEVAERNRLNSEEPVRDGDIVEVEGTQYRVNVVGDYSDCATLIEVQKAVEAGQ